MPDPLLIRRAVIDDAARLATLKARCFRETFLGEGFDIPYPPEEIERFERDAYNVKTIVRELSAPQQATWVAEDMTGALMGYARVGPCKLPHPDATAAQGELYQLYLRKAAQGSGAGRALMDAAMLWLEEHFPGPLWLGVWSGNDKAQRFYARYGFRKVGEYEFPVGDAWRDREYIFCRD